MPDTRRHRGAHPQDVELFAPGALPALRAASAQLAWLLTRGYAIDSSLKLVGDRWALCERQRIAVRRSTCSDPQRAARRATRCAAADLVGAELLIDGFNLLTTIEAALSGGVLLLGRDGCLRDLASMHGSYRKVEETLPALALVGEVLAGHGVAGCRWLLDEPVSNSGRLKTIVRETAARRGWNWSIDVVRDPDAVLARSERIVVTADAAVLDRGPRWANVARLVVESRIPGAWTIDFESGCTTE